MATNFIEFQSTRSFGVIQNNKWVIGFKTHVAYLQLRTCRDMEKAFKDLKLPSSHNPDTDNIDYA